MPEHIAEERIATYQEFWGFYVREHSKPLTRALHLIGTVLGLSLLAYVVAIGRWYFFPVFFVVGYVFAWFAHFAFEKNRPATFHQPIYSFMGDWKMFWQILTGQMAF